MSGPVLRVVWYRFLATFGHRWGGYLSVVLLVGLVGGVAMGSIAAARRTQSSFPVFLAGTNPSDLSVPTFGASASANYSVALTKEIGRLREVRHVEAWISLNAVLPRWVSCSAYVVAIVNLIFVPSMFFGHDPSHFYSAEGWGGTALAPAR